MVVRRTAAVPTPPRTTGDQAADLVAQINWSNDFYRATVVESGLLDPAFQSDADGFDAESLPDPEASSIALAQKTANEGFTAAASARAIADQALAGAVLLITPFTLSDADNQVTITFTTPFADADDYRVLCQAVDFTGTPAVDAFVVVKVDRTTTTIVITIAGAPGLGNSVTFHAFIYPN